MNDKRNYFEHLKNSEIFTGVPEVDDARKLATINVIKDLQPIEGADKIEVATVKGWKVVVQKGEFVIGGLCVYCEIDSVLPPKPEFAFLQKVRYRIKTIRLRGQISQGICFSMDVIPRDFIRGMRIEEMLDLDVTEVLEIRKYEAPIPAQLAGKVKGNFPSFLKKTDEERIQNIEWILTEYPDKLFYATEKVDGTSFTAYYNNGVFGICSRNLDLIETEDNTLWRVARELKLEEKMAEHSKHSGGLNFALQGELVGEGIQKNKYALKGQTVLFFNVFDIDKYSYYNRAVFLELISWTFALETVPVVSPVDGFKLFPTVGEMLEYAEGKSLVNPNHEREGIVVRPYEEIDHVKYGRISFKVISNKFLLKYED
jgi:RNA ligase (TIGR02306 family)